MAKMRKLTEEQIKDFADYQTLSDTCVCQLGFDVEIKEGPSGRVRCINIRCFDCWCKALGSVRIAEDGDE